MMTISQQLEEALIGERRGFPIGTKRERKDGTYIKTRQGWKRITSKKGRKEAERQESRRKMAGTVDALKDTIDKGKLRPGMSLGDHIKATKKVQKAHDEGFGEFKGKLQELAGNNAKVKGRVKTAESIMGKMVRKPKYQDAGTLQDVTGTRVIHANTNDVLSTVKKLKDQFDVVDEDDYITNPKDDGYMSYHMIVKDKDGLEKEVQIRTENQNKMGDWAHDIYKPMTPEQEEAVAKDRKALEEYSTALWKWFEKKDRGQDPGPEPECPEVAKKAFGCGPNG